MKRITALIVICTMLLTTPVFAGADRDKALEDLRNVEQGVQIVKQAVDSTQKEVDAAKYRYENAIKDLDILKDKKITFVRPSDMSKKEAEGYIKLLEHEIDEQEKLIARLKKEYGYAIDANKDANKDLNDQWNDYYKCQKVLESAQ